MVRGKMKDRSVGWRGGGDLTLADLYREMLTILYSSR